MYFDAFNVKKQDSTVMISLHASVFQVLGSVQFVSSQAPPHVNASLSGCWFEARIQQLLADE